MTIGEVRSIAAYWQGRLLLHSWRITVRYGTQHEFRAKESEFLYGRVEPNPVNETAEILVFRERDLLKAQDELNLDLLCGKSIDRVYEETVIHELLHVRLDPRERFAFDQAFETGLDVDAQLHYEMRYECLPQ